MPRTRHPLSARIRGETCSGFASRPVFERGNRVARYSGVHQGHEVRARLSLSAAVILSIGRPKIARSAAKKSKS
jgi:hypothetical protein